MFTKSCSCIVLASVLALVAADVRSLFQKQPWNAGSQPGLQGSQAPTPVGLSDFGSLGQSADFAGGQASESLQHPVVLDNFGGQTGGSLSSGQSFGGQTGGSLSSGQSFGGQTGGSLSSGQSFGGQTGGGESRAFESQQGFGDEDFSSTDSFVGVSGPLSAPADFDPRIINLQPSQQTGSGSLLISGDEPLDAPAQVTITREVTVDRFTTLTNLAYHSVPVTLTEFLKVTVTAPTFEAVTTPVDDMVLVSRVPVSRTDTITVTDTNSGYQYATEVSTVLYTITHKLYDIRQQTITSLVVQTQLVMPRIVSTIIDTEYETQTVSQTITHTIFEEPFVPRAGALSATKLSYASY